MILRKVDEIRARVRDWKRAGEVVGLVPTMGALHEGHLSLVKAAKAGADRVIVTVFVNPRQFNNAADLAKYPRTEAADAALLAPLGVDAVFVPEPEEVYPPGFASEVTVQGVALPLEGAMRPGHFAGVATVVTKLFNMTLADRAWFGEKDWQQLQVIRRMVTDLNLPVEIVGAPTARAADGLALSSRNARLSPAGRAMAPALHLWMLRLAQGAPAAEVEAALLAAGFERIDYLAFHDAETLGPPIPGRPQRLLAAVWLEGVRLIDNIPA